MSELLSAIREGCDPSLKNPSGEPTFGRLETLEALDCFQASVELLVAALDDVRCFGTTAMKELLRFYIARKEVAVVEDVVKGGNL